ncbi:hypothetical protein AXX17_AT2G11370 [Arabidopsis thaliana]|uniref:Uncharacterized protein n=1 Tax=Arabidopsis thaliana TaxID=3702 RepID=A0A178VZ28_ARATH|nr:hypothetical protein AXX17_AT2G11370 [Arabidopsis thaliana]
MRWIRRVVLARMVAWRTAVVVRTLVAPARAVVPMRMVAWSWRTAVVVMKMTAVVVVPPIAKLWW